MLNSCFDKDLRQDFNESNFITEVEGKEILLKTSYNSDRNLLGLVVAAPSPGSILHHPGAQVGHGDGVDVKMSDQIQILASSAHGWY